jgi:hypothetical protein
VFSKGPNINLMRDPRWGRNLEGKLHAWLLTTVYTIVQ